MVCLFGSRGQWKQGLLARCSPGGCRKEGDEDAEQAHAKAPNGAADKRAPDSQAWPPRGDAEIKGRSGAESEQRL